MEDISLSHQLEALKSLRQATHFEEFIKEREQRCSMHYLNAISSLRYALTYEKSNNFGTKEIVDGIVDTCKSRIVDIQTKPQIRDSSHEAELKSSSSSVINRGKEKISWKDVAGLELAKKILHEALILPIQCPYLFDGLRKPWTRVLIYGPPGTGKTRLAKVVAAESNCTFFSVSACDLLSSWVGGSEKLIKQLFTEAAQRKPSVIFFDEIDSLCRSRSDSEEEHSRRVKNELLKQFDGVEGNDNRIIILAATNRPWELDAAVLRRFEKKVYIPLPDLEARITLLKMHIGPHGSLSEEDLHNAADSTVGYSGSDIATVAHDALMEPIRELQSRLHNLETTQIRKIDLKDVLRSISLNPCNIQQEDIVRLEEFTKKYGQKS